GVARGTACASDARLRAPLLHPCRALRLRRRAATRLFPPSGRPSAPRIAASVRPPPTPPPDVRPPCPAVRPPIHDRTPGLGSVPWSRRPGIECRRFASRARDASLRRPVSVVATYRIRSADRGSTTQARTRETVHAPR